jgi:hypothetical protein
MRVRFRLSQLLARHNQTGHGLITRIKNATSIERHKVSRLLDDEEDKISLKHLGELCRFLIESCQVDPRELPGALFELEPSHFLSLLRSTPTLRTCFGVRQRSDAKPNAPWASGTDSFLHGKLLEYLLRPEPLPRSAGGDDSAAEGSRGRDRVAYSRSQPLQIRSFHQEQVHAASSARLDNPAERDDELSLLRQDAERVYRALHAAVDSSNRERSEAVGHVALLLGTIKSNPACELAAARTFAAVPWGDHGRSQADLAAGSPEQLVRTPAERAVPFYVRYRDRRNSEYLDPAIPSCSAGNRLAQSKVKCGGNGTTPGIYYETPGGAWECAPWSDDRDAALVLYDYDRVYGNVEVTMGGFTARATLMLADRLEQIADSLMPEPLGLRTRNDRDSSRSQAYVSRRRAVGAFVIEFLIDNESQMEPGVDRLLPPPLATNIIPIDPEVLARRLEPR